MATQTYTIGDYLLDRLAELGITELFGVPGDYNLHFLDHVVSHKKIRWVGNANELNAGYAADGYARLRGAGALLTTFGVGELSATNAIAGSYAESLPVIHIVGAPSKEIQAKRLKTHHSLGDGDYGHFLRLAREVTCEAEDLDAPVATEQIDHLIRQVLFHQKPGLIVMAADVAETPTEPPAAPLAPMVNSSTKAAEEAFEKELRQFLPGRKVMVLADLMVHRLGANDELNDMLEATKLPVATLSWGKSLVNEAAENFVGIYAGKASPDYVREAVEGADALVSIGVEFTDNTTAGFSTRIDPSRQVDIGRHEAHVGLESFTPLSLNRALEILHRVFADLQPEPVTVKRPEADDQRCEITGVPLTQEVLWQQVTKALTSNNIVLAEQGTSFFGMSQARVPEGSFFIGQPMWGSIGYTLPAMLGAGLADRSRRPVLLIGDGSAQLTIQELGQVIREQVNPVIVLVNNDGYTVERAIHGMEQHYNDIPKWDWQLATKFFGGNEENTLSLCASTDAELVDALSHAAANTDKMVLLEVRTAHDDVPEALRLVAEKL